jgi:hypothetical protein
MMAYKLPLTSFAELMVEALHVESDRPARTANAGLAARQDQTIVQTALRLGF